MDFQKKKKFPRIGKRIIKSAIAIALCFLVSILRQNQGIVFYSQLSALWCIQTYVTDMKEHAVQRTIGTIIGAAYGLLVLLLQQFLRSKWTYPVLIHIVIVSMMIIVVLYTTVLIHKKQASYFSCVVFLSIVVSHINESNPYLFVWNRFLDTMIGIVIGIGVNGMSLPRKRVRNVLFISGLDETLIDEHEKMTDYSRTELNRMLDDGIKFTLSTVRTPAVVAEMMQGIRLNLPIIVMDGAALYDLKKKTFEKVYVISKSMSAEIMQLLQTLETQYFTNIIIDDTLLIYYSDEMSPEQKKLVERLRCSSYRNYIKRHAPADESVVYFMVYDQAKNVKRLYNKLIDEGYDEHLKIIYYSSKRTPGYQYLKIYNKNANKENMIEYLKQEIGIEKAITFGSIEKKYDVVVNMGNMNQAVSTLKSLYEPIIGRKVV